MQAVQFPRTQHTYFILFLLLWTVLNSLHAAFADLANDEAYYWVYSRFPDWGYFDHPPAIAIWIRAGYALVQAEIGVRLLTVLSSTATCFLLWVLIKPGQTKVYVLLLISILIVHVGGFFTAPDIPFVLFATLYLVVLKEYLNKGGWGYAALVGLVAAAMVYSKYHAVLILLFSVLPNLRLFRKAEFWLAAGIAAVALLPHLFWQVDHDFVTFRYHLFERSIKPYTWQFTTDFIAGQFLIYGPLTSLLIPFALAKAKRPGRFGLTIKWIVIGTFAFFLMNSFRGRIEANWTIGAFPALMYWVYPAFESGALRKWLVRLFVPSLLVLSLFRIITILEILPRDFGGRNEFHGWQAWAGEISELAGDRVVLFRNNYRYPSKYMFYTGKPALSLNDEGYKGNQFDYLYEFVAGLQGRDALFIAHRYEPYLQYQADTLMIERHPYMAFPIEHFRSFNSLRITMAEEPESARAGGLVRINLSVTNPTDDAVDIPEDDQVEYYIVYMQADGRISKRIIDDVTFRRLLPGETVEVTLAVPVPEIAGTYFYRIGINWNCLGGKNSVQHKLIVTDRVEG